MKRARGRGWIELVWGFLVLNPSVSSAMAGALEFGSVSLGVIKVAPLNKALFRPNQALWQEHWSSHLLPAWVMGLGAGIIKWSLQGEKIETDLTVGLTSPDVMKR